MSYLLQAIVMAGGTVAGVSQSADLEASACFAARETQKPCGSCKHSLLF